jgi:cytidylate kinase
MSMATITISRQFGSNGDTVAQLLCDRLGYRTFDKNLMMGLAAQSGLAAEKVVDLPDNQRRARSLVERLFGSYSAPQGDPGTWAATTEAAVQDQLTVARFKYLIRAAYEQGNVVIIGRGGQAVLAGLPNVLHVRLVAPLELRVQRHAARAGLTVEAARESVQERDRASYDFVKRYFNIDRSDPALYDLIINTAKLTPSAATDLIISALTYLMGAPAAGEEG